MRQKGLLPPDTYRIDDREQEEIQERIGMLARAYVPEWHFDKQNPDIGSVIALFYAERMAENIKRYNALFGQYYTELINMTGISLCPARPAHSIVEIGTAFGAAAGHMLRRGTKLLGGPQESKDIVFQTAHDVYITESAVVSGFMTCAETGKVVVVIGNFSPVEYVSDSASKGNPVRCGGRAFRLFDFTGEGYGKNGLLLYHPHLFDAGDSEIRMEIKGAGNLIREISEGRYRLLCYTEEGFVPVADIRCEDGKRIAFRCPGKCRKVTQQGASYTALLLEASGDVENDVTAEDIRFSAAGEPDCAELVWDGSAELDPEKFAPFGDALSLYAECYLLHPYFAKAGAQVCISFGLEFVSHQLPDTGTQKEEELKIIRRKPAAAVGRAPAHVYANEISLAYYNGIGWKSLPVQSPVRRLFESPKAGQRRICFQCPGDWRRQEAGGVLGYALRLRILRADNCYAQPAVHHCPRICSLRVSYSYGGICERPHRLIGFAGSRERDLTAALYGGGAIPLFSRSIYRDTSLYLGFDKAPKDGPVSILFCMDDTGKRAGRPLAFFYSSRGGFCRLKVTDKTGGLCHSGLLLFMPPPDLTEMILEGQTAYWIKITDLTEQQTLLQDGGRGPLIRRIALNGVEVDNIETLEEEEYYMDASAPDLSFAVHAENILSVEVWVNETEIFSDSEMRRMLLSAPETVKAEYDFHGNISAFYVKWQEVENFDGSVPTDRHFVVDRMNNRIHFGDGVHVRIPRNTAGPAFRALVRCCSGTRGNVGIGEIDTTYGNVPLIDRVYNPVRAYGGEDMESVEEALRRGTTLINTGNRLVSAADFERAALDFCHRISQAKIVTGRKKDGTFSPDIVTLVIVMEDYREGRGSFLQIRRPLREHLLSRCSLSVEREKLEIVEPVYARITVEIWLQASDREDIFTLRRSIARTLEEYLDPAGSGCWEIGRSVTQSQIALAMGMEKHDARIRRMAVTALCADETGAYETDPALLSGNPYILVTGGTHKIHME